MGVDITMSIIKDEEVIAKDIYSGRNSEWFGNLQGEGSSREYDYFPSKYGIPERVPAFVEKAYKGDYYYGFHYIKVGDYIDWFEEYKPDLTAGWITTYDWWAYITKHIEPEEIYMNLSSIPQEKRADYAFHEINNPYNCSTWLYDYLNDNRIPMDAVIVYYFDC